MLNPLSSATPPSHRGPEDCASRGEAKGVFVGGTDWLLSSNVDRRTVLKGASSAALGLIASACGASGPSAPSSAPEMTTTPVRPVAKADAADSRETVYVFNICSKDGTLIDATD